MFAIVCGAREELHWDSGQPEFEHVSASISSKIFLIACLRIYIT